MNALTQWNPFQEMEALQNRLSSFSGWTPVRNGHYSPPEADWAPPVDVIETADDYVIRVDLPGVSRSDLSVTLEDGELILKATRQAEPLAAGAQYVSNERVYGTFRRTFGMPSWAEASAIQADFKHGVLTVKVQKTERARARTIAIGGE